MDIQYRLHVDRTDDWVAAIAIPVYQSYTTRAPLSEGLRLPDSAIQAAIMALLAIALESGLVRTCRSATPPGKYLPLNRR